MFQNAIIKYIISRLQETSTVRNLIRLIVVSLAFLGYNISPDLELHMLGLALALSSLIGVLLPDNLKTSKQESEEESLQKKLDMIKNMEKETKKTGVIDESKFQKETRVVNFGFGDKTFIPEKSKFTRTE
ncbi:MAG: hypothetical protein KC589_06025 [Nanoarchaeota archaeon]|nr:hypothetical protein [Nanoarchaeota archaeon]